MLDARLSYALAISAVLAVGCTSTNHGTVPSAFADAPAKDPRAVAVVADTPAALSEQIISAKTAGKTPLYFEVIGASTRYDFSPFVPVLRSHDAVIVVAYSMAYVFPAKDVTLRYSDGNERVDAATLPFVDLQKVDKGVARFARLKAQNAMDRQYRAKSIKAKQSACPDCALYGRILATNPFLARLRSVGKNSWQMRLTGVAVWSAPQQIARVSKPASQIVCDAYTGSCYYYSYPSIPAGYYGSFPCYADGYSYYGGTCGKPGKTPRPRPKPTVDPNPNAARLNDCLNQAAVTEGQENNGMTYWQGYCASEIVDQDPLTRAHCYAVGPQGINAKRGFCRAAFG